MDHQAEAYVAPRRTLAEANGNGEASNGAATAKKVAGKSKWGGAEVCPRCDKSVRELKNPNCHTVHLTHFLLRQVFIAELMRGAGKAWHKSCFTCLECKKRLDSSLLCEREGELYCKGTQLTRQTS